MPCAPLGLRGGERGGWKCLAIVLLSRLHVLLSRFLPKVDSFLFFIHHSQSSQSISIYDREIGAKISVSVSISRFLRLDNVLFFLQEGPNKGGREKNIPLTYPFEGTVVHSK